MTCEVMAKNMLYNCNYDTQEEHCKVLIEGVGNIILCNLFVSYAVLKKNNGQTKTR